MADPFRYSLIRPGCTVVCALSGGRDSMYLLCRLLEGAGRGGYTVHAAHFNHHLRPTAGRDEDFVRAWCDGHGVPLTVGGADVPAQAKARGEGMEECARALRYAFLERTAGELGGDALIATGHHAMDNAETMLLNLVRGCGLKGLSGIPEHRGNIIRPMLEAQRGDIDGYLSAHGVPHVEDETNEDLSCARNRVRQQLLPLLEDLNPQAVRHMAQTARRLHGDDEALTQASNLLFHMNARGSSIPTAALTGTPRAVALRAVGRLLKQEGLGGGSAHLDGIMALAASPDPSARLCVPGGVVRREYDRLVFEAGEGVPPPAEVMLTEGEILWGGWRLTCTPTVCPPEPGTPERFYLPPGGYTVRPRREGDGLRPPNRCYKSLKKWMIDLRIPARDRDKVPVIALNGRAVAAGGVGVDGDSLPSPGAPALLVTVEKLAAPQ